MSPADTVSRFLSAFEPSLGFKTAIHDYFTADSVYENVGLTQSTGIEDSLAVMQGFVDQMGFDHMKVQMLAIASGGNKVLTERIDDLYDGQGNKLVSLRVMGVFEVRDGKISAWRDYYDSAALAPAST